MTQAPSDPWDTESVTDAIAEAMSDVHDMDTGIGDFAKAAVRFLEKEGLLLLRLPKPKPRPVPQNVHIPADHSRNLSISLIRGERGVPGMAMMLSLTTSREVCMDFSAWLSLSQARQLAAALAAHADAVEAAFPVEVPA